MHPRQYSGCISYLVSMLGWSSREKQLCIFFLECLLESLQLTSLSATATFLSTNLKYSYEDLSIPKLRYPVLKYINLPMDHLLYLFSKARNHQYTIYNKRILMQLPCPTTTCLHFPKSTPHVYCCKIQYSLLYIYVFKISLRILIG